MDVLRLVSRKIRPKRPRFREPLKLKKLWLNRAIFKKDEIRSAYQNLLPALAGLCPLEPDLRQFNQALSGESSADPQEIWRKVLNAPLAARNLRTFADLVACTGNYGPQAFASALNKLARQQTSNPSLVFDLVVQSIEQSPALSPYIAGSVVEQITLRSPALSVRIMNQILAKPFVTVKLMALDAFFYGSKCDPELLATYVPQLHGIPREYRLPTKSVSMLSNNAHQLACARALQCMRPYLALNLEYDRLLRRVFTNSDLGARIVTEIATTYPIPHTFYPFIVKRLCEQAVNNPDLRPKRTAELDQLFNGQLLALAADSPQILLHLLIVRTIALDGVAATAPILNQWESSDERGVSLETYRTLFAVFRRTGHPQKCLEILKRVLDTDLDVDVPMVGEYLHFVASYYHLHVYLAALHDILPETYATLQQLGINAHVSRIADSSEPALCPLKPSLLLKHRKFAVSAMHETWLLATYRAVLATVESVSEAVELYQKYLEYAAASPAATSLKITDHFVDLLANKINSVASLDAAIHLFKTALTQLKLQFASDGRNHSKSLKMLCQKLIRYRRTDQALELLLFVAETPRAVIKGTSLQAVVQELPPEMRGRFVKWTEQIGAHIDLPEK